MYMQKLMVIFTFWDFNPKCSFWANLVAKFKIFSCKLKFGTKTGWNKQNSMAMFTFADFSWEYVFWATLPKNQSC